MDVHFESNLSYDRGHKWDLNRMSFFGHESDIRASRFYGRSMYVQGEIDGPFALMFKNICFYYQNFVRNI